MIIIEQYMYQDKAGKWQVLYVCGGGSCFTTYTGGFGLDTMYIQPMNLFEAERIISEIKALGDTE